MAKSDSCNQLATNTAIHLIRADGGIEWKEKDLVCVCEGERECLMERMQFESGLLSSPTLPAHSTELRSSHGVAL